MPTLPDLGKQLLESVRAKPRYAQFLPGTVRLLLRQGGGIPGENVETWLSSLAERQPYLTEAQASTNYGLFLEMTRELVGIVEARQHGVCDHAPGWLHRLVRLWHRLQNTVITFNYDTIVEQTIDLLDVPGTHGNLVGEILDYRPRQAIQGLAGAQTPSSFHLIKLHGSIDWYWTPGDIVGDSLCRKTTHGATEADLQAALAGKEPFVIPPLAGKSPFYSLALVPERWQHAAGALLDAERIFVLGYSVPTHDLAVVAMLTNTVPDPAAWHVADLRPSAVSDRIALMGFRRIRITEHRSLKDFVAWYAQDACQPMTRTITNEMANGMIERRELSHLLACGKRGVGYVISDLRQDPERLVLLAEDIPGSGPLPAEYPRANQLRDVCQGLTMPVVVRIRGRDHTVLGTLDPSAVFGIRGGDEWFGLEMQDVPDDEA
jgi:hypothetical protein